MMVVYYIMLKSGSVYILSLCKYNEKVWGQSFMTHLSWHTINSLDLWSCPGWRLISFGLSVEYLRTSNEEAMIPSDSAGLSIPGGSMSVHNTLQSIDLNAAVSTYQWCRVLPDYMQSGLSDHAAKREYLYKLAVTLKLPAWYFVGYWNQWITSIITEGKKIHVICIQTRGLIYVQFKAETSWT